jgi:hypothetical protein
MWKIMSSVKEKALKVLRRCAARFSIQGTWTYGWLARQKDGKVISNALNPEAAQHCVLGGIICECAAIDEASPLFGDYEYLEKNPIAKQAVAAVAAMLSPRDTDPVARVYCFNDANGTNPKDIVRVLNQAGDQLAKELDTELSGVAT